VFITFVRYVSGQICKVLRHIATTEALQVSAKHAEVNLRVYAPQIVTAAQALAHYPCSKIIKENLEGPSLRINVIGVSPARMIAG